MRVALCGSQVAGKSSLLRAIANQRSLIQRLVSRHRRDLQVIRGESEDPLIRLTLASLKKSDSEIEIVAPTGAMFWPEKTFRRVLNGATHALFAFAKPIDGDYQSEHFSFQKKYYEIFIGQAGQLGFESSAVKIVLTKSDIPTANELPTDIAERVCCSTSSVTGEGIDQFLESIGAN